MPIPSWTSDPFELLVATVLSAQTTDLRVNQTTPALFAAYPTPEDMAAAVPEKLEEIIRPTGFFRAKARSLMGLSAALRDDFGGEVPGRLADLVKLPGVGRKTANVVLGNAFGVPGITVDTHFGRLVRRWKWTEQEDPEKVEAEIAAIFPKSEWTMLSHRVVFHGRRICHSRKPACGACPIAALCPAYGEGETDPEKAKKLLKYEMGGYPGQRLKPAPGLSGQSRTAAGSRVSGRPAQAGRCGTKWQTTGVGTTGVPMTHAQRTRAAADAAATGTSTPQDSALTVTTDGLPGWLEPVAHAARTVRATSSAASCRLRAAPGASPPS